MLIEESAPTSTADEPDDAPVQHGALGSAARLSVLHYLSSLPLGARRHTIAQATGLDITTTIHVLTMLRQAGRVVCDRRSADSMWFVPSARAKLGPSALARLREQAERLESEAP